MRRAAPLVIRAAPLRRLSAAGTLALLCIAPSLACSSPTVIRVIDGHEIAGRFVSDRAYAMYARGAEAEARGDLEGARINYLAAADQDEDSADVWTRVGAVSCKLGREADAREAFEKAVTLDETYEPLHRERAACTLASARPTEAETRAALDDATLSLSLDPDSEESALLYARAAEAAGEAQKAERVLRELVVREPLRATGWRALHDLAERHHDAPLQARAARALQDLPQPPATITATTPPASSATRSTPPVNATTRSTEPRASSSLEDVDAAIARGAIDEARVAAKHARLSPAELAVRAAALGKTAFAKTQAELVFKADPTNTSAAIALAVASDLARDDAGVTTAFTTPSALATPPSPLARLLLTELILRRADRDAAATYAGAIAPAPAEADALLRAVTDRVRAALQK